MPAEADRRNCVDDHWSAEFCQYVGIGKTKAREMLANPCCKYAVRIGRRVFVHKELFDEEVKKSAKFQLTM